MSWISLCLGTGMIKVSAPFQDKGSQPSQKEIFKISMMGGGGVKRSRSPLRAIRGYCLDLVPWLG